MKKLTKDEILSIAQSYRESNQELRPYMAERGYVRIFEGKPYGWVAELGEARTERPSALIVSLDGQIFEAIGGNDIDGAIEWTRLTFE